MPFLNTSEKHTIARLCPSEEDFAVLTEKKLLEPIFKINWTSKRLESYQKFSGYKLLEDAANLEAVMKKRGMAYYSIFNKWYPHRLRHIYDPPFGVFLWGSLPEDYETKSVLAVVGTRSPSLNGRQQASIFVKECASYVQTTISGLAYGIDGTVHKAALSVNAHTTAVLGSGFNHLYPAVHRKLAMKILESGGCLVSEYHPNETPFPHYFPARNRLIAGLSDGVVIMEAPYKSGTYITAKCAIEQNRDLFIHASAIQHDPKSPAFDFHEQGAPLVSRGEDLLVLWQLYDDKPLSPLRVKGTEHLKYKTSQQLNLENSNDDDTEAIPPASTNEGHNSDSAKTSEDKTDNSAPKATDEGNKIGRDIAKDLWDELNG